MQLYFRYIDDIYFQWAGSGNKLQYFISKIKEIHPSIKFDFNYSKIQIHFLDLTITKTSSGKRLTTLYRKEIGRRSYLHRKSEHPETLKRNIPYWQALRLKRICTTKEDLTNQSKALTKRLVEKRCNENEIQQQFSKTFTTERGPLLNHKNQTTSKNSTNTSYNPTLLTYNPTLPDIKREVNRH